MYYLYLVIFMAGAQSTEQTDSLCSRDDWNSLYWGINLRAFHPTKHSHLLRGKQPGSLLILKGAFISLCWNCDRRRSIPHSPNPFINVSNGPWRGEAKEQRAVKHAGQSSPLEANRVPFPDEADKPLGANLWQEELEAFQSVLSRLEPSLLCARTK